MPLPTGSRLGPYEIVAPLGAGGMGEVYRARDPRMGREVAIKVSAERFSDRFDREVRAVASLNHPNICHIYDVGPNYLVMELVEGQTLAERIHAGAIPLEESLRIAHQIGDALEAAHAKGVIHRDLKPANIKLKPDGEVKVLDFGLAKITEQAAAASSPEESPTVTVGGTIAGQIMGTAAYMAPEQARGKTVDKRADIWAFGVVLYEMLTARRLFGGETISDTLAGVLTREPDWSVLPAKAQHLLKSCLAKDPKRRLRDIGDAWQLLDDAPVPAPAATRLPWAIAGVLAAVSIVLGATLWRSAKPFETTPHVTMRLDFDLGPDIALASTTGPSVVFSPDGTRLVFVSSGQDGIKRLFTRRLDQPKAVQMAGTEKAYAPFFSPDGLWVGFFAKGKLKKIRTDGGDPVTLCDAPQGRGGTWGEDGNIIAALNTLTGLCVVPSGGGKPTSLTELLPGESTHRWPQILPGGKEVLFSASTAGGNFDESNSIVFSLQGHRRKTVLEHEGLYPRYLPSGHLGYVKKGFLFAAPFDLERLEVRGAPITLAEVSSNNSVGFAQFDFARTGAMAYRTGGRLDLMTLEWLDAAGRTESAIPEPALYTFPRLSPDGSHVAAIINQGAGSDVFVFDSRRSDKARLTDTANATPRVTELANPTWTPEGMFVVFRGGTKMYWARADGVGKPQLLMDSKNTQLPMSFTQDGTLAYSELTPSGASEIRTLHIEIDRGQLRATGESRLFQKTSTADVNAVFSPDGRWLAYADSPDGEYQVYVRAFPDRDFRVPVSNAGGTMPRWSQAGQELFYRTEDQQIMVANYAVKGESFVVDKPRVWREGQLANTGTAWNYDVAPDGKRCLVLLPKASPESPASRSHIMIATDLFEKIRRNTAEKHK